MHLSGIDVPMHSFIGDTVAVAAAAAALAKTRTIPFYFVLFAPHLPVPSPLSSEFPFNMQCDRIYVVPPKQYVCESAFLLCFVRIFPAFVVLFSFIAFLCIFVFHPSSCYRINMQLTIALCVRERENCLLLCFHTSIALHSTILINVFLMENCFEKNNNNNHELEGEKFSCTLIRCSAALEWNLPYFVLSLQGKKTQSALSLTLRHTTHH